MPNPVRFQPSAFPELTSVSDARWALLSGLIAIADRPHNRHNDSFIKPEHWLAPVTGPTMFVMRWQMTDRPDAKKPQRSVILLALKFAFDPHSGQVYVDSKRNDGCNPAAFDCALPRSTWDVYRHHLDPASNKTAADLALIMSREANRVLDAGDPIPYQPTLPDFYFAFAQRPVFEKGSVVKREASAALGVVAEQITDAELETFFWSQSFEHEGRVFVPQRYLARQGDYPVHPVDGSSRPDGGGKPGQWKGLWYFGDGRWNAGAQRPVHVYAHMGNVLGRQFRNPAFTVLKANSFFPADMTYPQFAAAPDIEGLHQRFTDALAANSTIIDVLIAAMRQTMGRAGDMATDEDLKFALDHPESPMNLSFATSVRMVRYSAPPRADALTWQLPGGYFNLFDTKRIWTSRVEPAMPRSAGVPEHGALASAGD